MQRLMALLLRKRNKKLKFSVNNATSAEKQLLEQLDGMKESTALKIMQRFGLPSRRVEAYHYTDLKALVSHVPPLVNLDDLDQGDVSDAGWFDLTDSIKIPVRNGFFGKVSNLPEGFEISKNSGSALTEREDMIVALNRALTNNSLNIKISGAPAKILHIDWQMLGNAAHSAGSIEIELDKGAKAIIIETISGSDQAHLANFGSRINLGEGAGLTHIVLDFSSRKTTRLQTIEYEIGQNAKLHNLLINSGAKLSRTQIFTNFNGEGAVGDFNGLNLVDEGQHCDISLDTTHKVPDTISTQKFKAVVRNRAKAIFQGRILVESIAQKTDAKMMIQGLMLSEGAQILCKPELEIFADDVQCGHGSTCGELDEDSLFYLMSRGIRRDEATSMLIRAFAEELLTPIRDLQIKDLQLYGQLSGVLDNWLDGKAKV